MPNTIQSIASNDFMVHLKKLLDQDPDIFFSRLRQLFKFSNDSHDHIKMFSDYINKGFTPVIYSNHQSHTDGVILTILIEEIIRYVSGDNLKGFLCPVAASMASGDQNLSVQSGTFLFQPIFNKIGFIYVPIIREDDRRKYGMQGSNREAIEKLLYAPNTKYGLTVFPEGTVRGGRLDKDGRIYGMQDVEGGGILLRCMHFWQSQNKKIVLLPVGIMNSYQTFSPDNYDVPKALMDMMEGKGEVKQYVNIAIAKPFTDQELTTSLGRNIDPKSKQHIDYLMRQIANLLPLEARGHYAT